MRFDFTTTGIRAVAALLAMALLIGYHAQSARLRRQVEELELLRSRVADVARRVDEDLVPATRAESRRSNAMNDELSGLRSAVLESKAETRAAYAALSQRVRPDSRVLTEELLAPAVLLQGPVTVGSGTLVCSRPDPSTGEPLNYVLTAWHVPRDILSENPGGAIQVTLYERDGGKTVVPADVAAHSSAIDAALLRLRTDRLFERVASVMPEEEGRSVAVWDPIVAVGCPLGNDPIPTRGAIASLDNPIDGANYWMINAPGYFGNSGGGVFSAESRRLIGVYSKVYTYQRAVVSHMGLIAPITAIHGWLRQEGLDHLLEPGRALDVAAASAAK